MTSFWTEPGLTFNVPHSSSRRGRNSQCSSVPRATRSRTARGNSAATRSCSHRAPEAGSEGCCLATTQARYGDAHPATFCNLDDASPVPPPAGTELNSISRNRPRSQLRRFPLIERPAEIDQAPPGSECVKRLPSRDGARPGECARSAQDEVGLPRVRRRPDLGDVPRRPPDSGGLRLWRPRSGEHKDHEQCVGQRQPRKLRRRGDDDGGIAGLHCPGKPRDGVPLGGHRRGRAVDGTASF